MSALLKPWLAKKIEASSLMDFPGFRLRAYQNGQEILDFSQGDVYEFYDLASLTKIIFTTTYFMASLTEKKIKLFQPVHDVLPWFPHRSVRIGDLLNHSAGNSWWQPFYKKIDRNLSPLQRYQQLENLVQLAPRSRRRQALYSDIDFFILGSLMQRLENRPLGLVWQDLKGQFFPKTQFHFNPLSSKPLHPRSNYAPTEKCPWRKKVLQAEVHDENAWALGGVGPHAGLFGTLDDVADYGLWLRSLRNRQKNTGLVSAAVFKKFTTRSLPIYRGDWGYGFMLPSKNKSSAGNLFSKKAYGHTGFTGTSLWFDPQRDLLICLLSNRVHPTRKQQGFVQLRPMLHDWVVQFLEGKR